MKRFVGRGLFGVVSLVVAITLVIKAYVFSSVPADTTTNSSVGSRVRHLRGRSGTLRTRVGGLGGDGGSRRGLGSTVRDGVTIIRGRVSTYGGRVTDVGGVVSRGGTRVRTGGGGVRGSGSVFGEHLHTVRVDGANDGVRVLLNTGDFSRFLRLSRLATSISTHSGGLVRSVVTRVGILGGGLRSGGGLLRRRTTIGTAVTRGRGRLGSRTSTVRGMVGRVGGGGGSVRSSGGRVSGRLRRGRGRLGRVLCKDSNNGLMGSNGFG